MPKKPADQRRRSLPKLGQGTEETHESTRKLLASATRTPSDKRRGRPFLIVIGGGSAGEMHALREGEMIIGRARASTIRLDDDGVSRSHARVTSQGSAVHIEDLQSANGTFINGEPAVSR